MNLICTDLLSGQIDQSNTTNGLFITGHFTQYAQAFLAKDQHVSTVAKVLWEQYFRHYGLPAWIHSDQGRDFESHLLKDLLQVAGVKKSARCHII